ncbi:MAG: RNA 2',3'-cyclic phosphodiesterase [Acidimicrobiia bacterium]|nr:MAG: RNA 2',3'-cyclic phosphodiesterase [Acidimicrobiia bacterium]
MSDHAFLAVDLTSDARHMLAAALAEASPGPPVPGRRPPPENWHITLRFLGECDELTTEAILRELDETLDLSGGVVHATGIAAFPRASKASVMYVAIADDEGLLASLSTVCEDAARDVGFSPEERPFVPHLTLSRLRPSMDLRRLVESFASFRVPLEVGEVTLFRTRRTRTGLEYEAIDSVPLQA